MVKLRKLIIETEGSAAPQEIDAEEGCGGLGTEGNMGSRESREEPTQGTGTAAHLYFLAEGFRR